MKSTFCWHVSSRHNNVKPASVFEGLADKLRVCLPPSASMIASVAPPSQRGRREPPHCLRSGSKGRIASTDLPQLSRDRLRTTHYYDIAFEILASGGSGSSGAGFYTCDAARFASGLQYLFMNFESVNTYTISIYKLHRKSLCPSRGVGFACGIRSFAGRSPVGSRPFSPHSSCSRRFPPLQRHFLLPT